MSKQREVERVRSQGFEVSTWAKEVQAAVSGFCFSVWVPGPEPHGPTVPISRLAENHTEPAPSAPER